MTGPISARTPEANREKRLVALTSVLAAVFLTGLKLGVGLWTGSLGLLAEAAHSGLDLVAAAVTLFAVRASARPADREHTYGHGKIENLSALFETFLLLVTCVWIIYEAARRLFFETPEIDVNVWAFLVVLTSIVVDISRSRALRRVAVKYQSQALEADALHFSTDIWSSLVVFLGLGLVWLAQATGQSWLIAADALAALGVACIVIWISYKLGRKSLDDLLDAAPPGLLEDVAEAAKVDGVVAVERVRVRRSGPEAFADVTVSVDAGAGLEHAHDVATRSESAVRAVLPGADVVVHVEPAPGCQGDVLQLARRLAARHGLRAHGLRIYEQEGRRALELHLEVGEGLRVEQAHDLATAFEADLQAALPDVARIVTHLEPAGEAAATQRAEEVSEASVLKALEELRRQGRCPCQPHEVRVQRVGRELTVSFHCPLKPEAGIAEAHALTERLERDLRKRIPRLSRVVIHVEPLQDDAGATAGRDAGATAGRDAGATAGRDAGVTAGRDAGATAGRDAGVTAGPQGPKVLIAGASGFVGRHAVAAVVRAGLAVRALVRGGPARSAVGPRAGESHAGDMTDAAGLAGAAEGCGAVLHLVGLIRETEQSFESVHARGTLNLLAEARRAGVRRFVFLSGLGSRPGARARYHQTKYAAEQAVLESGMEAYVFQASVIFGPEDKFFNMLVDMARGLFLPPWPIMPVAGNAALQPVWVEDVAECLARALRPDFELPPGRYELGGPEPLSLREIARLACRAAGRRRVLLSVPPVLLRPAAWFQETFWRSPLLTRDQLLMLEEDGRARASMTERILGRPARGLEDYVRERFGR